MFASCAPSSFFFQVSGEIAGEPVAFAHGEVAEVDREVEVTSQSEVVAGEPPRLRQMEKSHDSSQA